MLSEISFILWIVVIIVFIVFVTMIFAHITGPDDYTHELNILFHIIIFGLTIGFIIFLISQYQTIKLMNEVLEIVKSITTNY